MESFGFWYKLVEDKDDKNPEFDLHVNFWFLGDILKGKVKNPYLDIGIKIQNYKNLSNLVFSFPFHVPQKNLVDLASKMSVKNNASIVFNEECEIETQKEYTLIKIPGKEKTDDKKLLIFPLEQAVENIYELTDYKEKSYITVKFDEFRTYLKNSGSDLERYSDIYIRFRIQNIDLENILYFDSEPFNKSLDSAFSGTRVLDFKINEKRNIDKNITARMEQKEELLVEFGQIHFLVIKIIKDIYEMHKNKYDHNILLNDIQKLDKIQHKHSLVAIRFPDTSAEKKYLVYYDERWDCKLFLNYKTVDRADEESVINKVSADLNVDKSQINCRYISSKVQEKYSESHQENRIYNHRLYEIKIQVFPEDEQKENFVVNGRHYYWMSISDMERDPNIVKKNLDVIDFVKESMHA